jgi:hypothetical protein
MTKTKHDWTMLDPKIDRLRAQGLNDTQIARELGLGRQTLVDHLRHRATAGTPTEYPGTPEHHGTLEAHPGIPEHQGTLEGHPGTQAHSGTLEAHQEVIEDIQESVPDAPHIGDAAVDQGTLEHLSTPEVHPELSPTHSGVPIAHPGVPARQEMAASIPMGHPSTPTAEDWELWTVIKARWSEVEKLLADRQALLGTPRGTPGHTRKKTYVFDERHIALIDRYAEGHRLELKDVLYQALEEFFQRRGCGEEAS